MNLTDGQYLAFTAKGFGKVDATLTGVQEALLNASRLASNVREVEWAMTTLPADAERFSEIKRQIDSLRNELSSMAVRYEHEISRRIHEQDLSGLPIER